MVQKANRGEPLVARGYYTPRGKGLVTPAFSFGAQVAEVEVDKDTGIVKVTKMYTAHDCGTVINPMAVEGQLEGSIHMGLGYALSEELIVEEGRTFGMGTAMATFMMAMTIGQGTGPILLGGIVDLLGVDAAFYYGGTIPLIGIALFFWFTRNYTRGRITRTPAPTTKNL